MQNQMSGRKERCFWEAWKRNWSNELMVIIDCGTCQLSAFIINFFFFSFLFDNMVGISPSFNGLVILYTGLVKIMKKYEKRSGALIRLPFIQKVLQEPFYTTDVLNDLVKECQGMLDHLLSNNELASRELAEIRHMESMYMKLTESALRVLKEVRSGSSTVSVFSLPPLQNNAMEWRNLALEEQADE